MEYLVLYVMLPLFSESNHCMFVLFAYTVYVMCFLGMSFK